MDDTDRTEFMAELRESVKACQQAYPKTMCANAARDLAMRLEVHGSESKITYRIALAVIRAQYFACGFDEIRLLSLQKNMLLDWNILGNLQLLYARIIRWVLYAPNHPLRSDNDSWSMQRAFCGYIWKRVQSLHSFNHEISVVEGMQVYQQHIYGPLSIVEFIERINPEIMHTLTYEYGIQLTMLCLRQIYRHCETKRHYNAIPTKHPFWKLVMHILKHGDSKSVILPGLLVLEDMVGDNTLYAQKAFSENALREIEAIRRNSSGNEIFRAIVSINSSSLTPLQREILDDIEKEWMSRKFGSTYTTYS